MSKRILAAGLTALMLAGGASALIAQPASPPPPTEKGGPAAGRMTSDDRSAMTDARVAGLKAGLRLTPEQEKNWSPVEKALRDLAQQREAAMFERDMAREKRKEAKGKDRPRPDAMEALRRNSDQMAERASGLKRLADAADPLYKSLDEAQKRRFGALLRVGMRGPGRGGKR